MKDPDYHNPCLATCFMNVTKEQRKFHVMLPNNDSFVHNWLKDLVGADRF